MSSSEKQKLLRDILQDRQYDLFRSQIFEEGLSTVRARKPRRSWPAPLALAASLLMLGSILWLIRISRIDSTTTSVGEAHEVVRSLRLDTGLVVRSMRNEEMMIETAGTLASFELVHSVPSELPELNDNELLALFKGRPAGLFRTDQGAELVVLSN